MLVFATETSCDETSVCLMENRSIIEHITFSQEIHKMHGGVVPELASRAHQKNIIPVVNLALSKANIEKNQLDAIAYTRGPGLLGSLLVGSSFAKSLAMSLNIPLIEVNHMQAHLLCHLLMIIVKSRVIFPLLVLIFLADTPKLYFAKIISR